MLAKVAVGYRFTTEKVQISEDWGRLEWKLRCKETEKKDLSEQ